MLGMVLTLLTSSYSKKPKIGLWSRPAWGKKLNRAKRTRSVTKVIQDLPSKSKALSSSLTTTKKKLQSYEET
jgi:hypothetical protein